MFDKIIGFIGAGNMGSAMIGGILNASPGNHGADNRQCTLQGDTRRHSQPVFHRDDTLQ